MCKAECIMQCNATVCAKYTYMCVCKQNTLHLWLCAAVSRALRGGVGDPCSVTLSTSRLFLSGRQRPWRVSIGESTRFRGGSAEEYDKVIKGFTIINFMSLKIKTQKLYLITTILLLRDIAASSTFCSLLKLLSLCIYFHFCNSEMYDHAQSDFSTGLSLAAPSVTVINLASFALAEQLPSPSFVP